MTEVPDAVVEVISPDSGRMDRETKLRDYERFGVKEYWLVDAQDKSFAYYCRAAGGFFQAPTAGAFYDSQAITGLRLDLDAIRAVMT